MEAVDPRPQLHPIADNLLERDAPAAPPDEKPAADRVPRARRRRGVRSFDRPKRDQDRPKIQEEQVDPTGVVSHRNQPATGAPQLRPIARGELPRTAVRAVDDGTVESDSLLGVHSSVGADPLNRSPARQFDSSHEPDCTDRSLASRPLSPVVFAAVVEATLRARGPFSLRDSAVWASDATRRFDGRVLVGLFAVEDGLARACAWQQADGRIELRSHSEEALEQLLATLPLEADHSEFLQRFAGDPLLGRTLEALPGKRPIRLGSVTQALVRAVCGQLITSSEARKIERRLIRWACETDGAFCSPPTPACFAGRAPVELQRFGLTARKASTIVRLSRTVELERLRELHPRKVAQRLERERGLGPWSSGVIGLQGLGTYELGLVGDLGLIKLCTALLGRPAEPADTAELLAPYGEWQGLASAYLLAGIGRGLLPVRSERGMSAAA
jgi:3-methyladenine DNA glycosylase/8-oxoguanine DNA glycosylase